MGKEKIDVVIAGAKPRRGVGSSLTKNKTQT